MKKIAVLISNTGTGTNLSAIIEGIEKGVIQATLVVVISDTKDAKGLERAKQHNLPIEICLHKEALLLCLQTYSPDYIALCGWKQIITDTTLEAFPNRIINIHPGLIPSTTSGSVLNPDGTKGIWNKGKMTNKAIQNVLDLHATYAGATHHFLTKELDFGPVIARCFEKVEKNDTVDSLYTRLKQKENKMYVKVLQRLCK